MNRLFCPPHPCCFSACVFLCRSGGFQLRSQLDPLRAHQPPSHQPQLRRGVGGGVPREGGDGARRPKQPPRQDQTWQSPCSQPGTREGKLAGGSRPSWRGWGVPRRQRRLQQPPARVRSDGVPWARRVRNANPMGQALGWLRDPGAWPSHRGRSGPRPGVFRARAAACLGKSRPPSRRRSPARQSGGGDSRNLPGDRRRVTGQNRPM